MDDPEINDDWSGMEEDEDDMFDFFSGSHERTATGNLSAAEDTESGVLDRSTNQALVWQWVRLVGPEDIRVFSIEPAGSKTEAVHCTFRRTDLKKPSSYFALSYVWGPTHDDGSHLTDTIYCDSFPMRVTATLHEALKSLRRLQDEGELNVPAMWVDALCIDQSNVMERGLQVMLMGRIFDMLVA